MMLCKMSNVASFSTSAVCVVKLPYGKQNRSKILIIKIQSADAKRTALRHLNNHETYINLIQDNKSAACADNMLKS
jgi:hypothetical protein